MLKLKSWSRRSHPLAPHEPRSLTLLNLIKLTAALPMGSVLRHRLQRWQGSSIVDAKRSAVKRQQGLGPGIRSATRWVSAEFADSTLARGSNGRWFLVLASIALIYAFLAGLHTIADYDTCWPMATARWVVQQHHVPSVDVLSYTMQGQPWIYPVGTGLILYLAFLAGGYALLSWISAAACVGTVALLLRRGNPLSAILAILAVPLIAWRTAPRADGFSTVLFAAFLSLLWENYQTGRARLWLLPLLMLAWVNVHFGFVAGLGLLLAYAGVEVSEMVLGKARRCAAMVRLRRASGWLLCSAVVTLANPWGWRIYQALLRQTRAATYQEVTIAEWTKLPLNWVAFSRALSLRDTEGAVYVLLVIAVVASVLALFRAQLGAAVLLLAAAYAPVRHVRMGAVFSCVLVIVGGPILWDAMLRLASHIRRPRIRSITAVAAVVLLAGLAFARCFDLVTNRHYFGGDNNIATFGTGLSWWFPQRAVAFIQREKLPGEVFNDEEAGDYLAWALGPQRRDYIDVRDTLFGKERIKLQHQLRQTSPDSAIWQQEAEKYHINTILLSIGRYDGLGSVPLKDFCNSRDWRPVYLDEVSAVFVRRTPETQELISRLQVDCATAPLPVPPLARSRSKAFNQWANAATVLAALGRNLDALDAADKAIAIFPGSATEHLVRAQVLYEMGRYPEVEQEYLKAVSLHPNEFTWLSLAYFYQDRGRSADAMMALKKAAAQPSARPEELYLQIGSCYLRLGRPKEALVAFNEAVQRATPQVAKAIGRGSFRYSIATGRARAYEILGDIPRGISYQEEAIRLAPDEPQPWLNLAGLYHLDGRLADEESAKAQAATLAGKQHR